MNTRPILSRALAAVQFHRPVRNANALHDAAASAKPTQSAPIYSAKDRHFSLTGCASTDRLTASGFWSPANAEKARNSLKEWRSR